MSQKQYTEEFREEAYSLMKDIEAMYDGGLIGSFRVKQLDRYSDHTKTEIARMLEALRDEGEVRVVRETSTCLYYEVVE